MRPSLVSRRAPFKGQHLEPGQSQKVKLPVGSGVRHLGRIDLAQEGHQAVVLRPAQDSPIDAALGRLSVAGVSVVVKEGNQVG